MTGALHRIDGLMSQAEGLSFDLTRLDSQWRAQYPASYDATITMNDMAQAARRRWQDAMSAFRETMRIQSQIVENVRGDQQLLGDLVNQSQGAVGLAKTERWTAILTVAIQPPRNADALRKNPLGLFVNAIDWSRDDSASADRL